MRRAPSLRQIEVFWTVLEAGSVSAAARTLNVAQPGLSRMLRHMEDGLGFRLFERAAGRLVPTAEGTALFHEARRVNERVAGFGALAARLGRAEGESLRVGAGASLANWPVPLALARVRAALPDIAIGLNTLGVSEMPDYLNDGRGDAVVVLAPLNHPSLRSERIGEVPLICAVPRGHPLDADGPVTIEAVNAHSVIAFDAQSSLGEANARAFAPVGGAPARVAAEVRLAAAALALVEAGVGIALVDACAAARGSGAGVARRVLQPVVMLPVHVVVVRRAARSIGMRRLAAELRAILAHPPAMEG